MEMKIYTKLLKSFSVSEYWGYKRGEGVPPNLKIRNGEKLTEEYHLSNQAKNYGLIAERISQAKDRQRPVEILFVRKYNKNYINGVDTL